MQPEPRFLLVIACSRRKRPETGLLPAIERYDGVNFRVVRKLAREGRWPESVDLLILSARYGLLEPDSLIEDYDVQMTPERARQLRPGVTAAVAGRIACVAYTEVFFNLGRVYLATLDGWERILPSDVRVIVAPGGIGRKAGAMLGWLLQRAGT